MTKDFQTDSEVARLEKQVADLRVQLQQLLKAAELTCEWVKSWAATSPECQNGMPLELAALRRVTRQLQVADRVDVLEVMSCTCTALSKCWRCQRIRELKAAV